MSKKPINKKKLIRGLIAGFLTLAALGGIYYFAIFYVLADYANMPYITFTYNLTLEEGQTQPEVTIDKVNINSDYPSYFIIPGKLLGYNVTKIGDEAFSLCTRLETVIMPDSIKSIGSGAFLNCTNLASIKFSKNVEYIGTDALTGTAFLNQHDDGFIFVGDTLYTYKGIIPDGTIISYGSGEEPNTIYLDSDIQYIADGMFKNQTGIAEVEFPEGLETIGASAFEGCTGITSITFPDSLTSIGDSAFSGTTALEHLDLPDNLASLGTYAFQNSGFEGTIHIPANVTVLPIGAFMGASNLQTVAFSGNIEKIQDYAFKNCSSLRSISFPNSTNWIGTGAFSNDTSLVSITLPQNSSYTIVGEELFSGCTSLSKVSVFSNITSIRKNAFNNTPDFRSMIILDDNWNETTPENIVTIPANVTALLDFAFRGSGLRAIFIPSKVTTLNEGLFQDATELNNVEFDESSHLIAVKSAVFKGCTNLLQLDLPDTVTSIADSFLRESGITSFTFPHLITTINEYSFYGCANLTSVTLPAALNTIKSYAFQNCTGLTSIVIPDSTKYIYDYAFQGSINLTIYAEATSKPSNWKTNWNVDGVPVVWGYVAP